MYPNLHQLNFATFEMVRQDIDGNTQQYHYSHFIIHNEAPNENQDEKETEQQPTPPQEPTQISTTHTIIITRLSN